MATGTAGSEARQFHTQQIHFLRKTIAFSDRGTQVTVGKIPAGSVIHAAMSGVIVTTLFNGTGTDLVDVGITSNDDLYGTDIDVSSIGFKALDEGANTSFLVSTDTTITATYADANSDATTGSLEVVIAYIPDIDG